MGTPVPMFWDADNLPHMVDNSLIISNVDAALKTYHPDFFLSKIFICASNVQDFTRIQTPECHVSYLRTPVRNLFCDGCPIRTCSCPGEVGGNQDRFTRVKEYTNRMIMQEMMSYTHDFPNQEQPLLLVTTDRVFRYSIKDLRNDGYLILTAFQGGLDSVPLVAQESVNYWLWENFQNRLDCEVNYDW